MDEGIPHSGPPVEHHGPPVRNISTAPAYTTSLGLEAVQEEDENTAPTPRPDHKVHSATEDSGIEADDEADHDPRSRVPGSAAKSRHGHSSVTRDSSPLRPDTSASNRGHSDHKVLLLYSLLYCIISNCSA